MMLAKDCLISPELHEVHCLWVNEQIEATPKAVLQDGQPFPLLIGSLLQLVVDAVVAGLLGHDLPRYLSHDKPHRQTAQAEEEDSYHKTTDE